MPFQIVRNDITNMQVDAIVNTANPRAAIGSGVDTAIHAKAGSRLLETRKTIGKINDGNVVVTPGFDLPARFVIHAVGPVWWGGNEGEEQCLRRCYDNALRAALLYGCESVAFPLLAAGNNGFPNPLALKIATDAFNDFLREHELQIYLVVFGQSVVELSEKLFHSIESFIDENYIRDATLAEYGYDFEVDVWTTELRRLNRKFGLSGRNRREDIHSPQGYAVSDDSKSLDDLLENTDAGFSETLMKLIDRSGKKDSDVYKKATVDRKLFSKIRSNPNYKPTKVTAIAFALALELDLKGTQNLIGRAGYTLSHSSKFDIIVEYFILQKNYNIIELDTVLFNYNQPTIGSDL
ncbi:MAG: macro domain-containing protein [Oscillospiraceae bacterium]|nr:macro domain-containing protein [Oscillospiraceae bacterium]